MGIGYKGTIVGLAVIALSTVAASAAIAQETFDTPTTGVPSNIPDQLDQVQFSNDRDYFRNRSIPRQVSYMFGPGILIRNSFPENEIARDGKAIYLFYQDLLARQMSSRPVIRTPDLPTPFNQSIREITVEAARPLTTNFPPTESTSPIPATPLQTKPRVPALW
ncbi:hypothetical protein [Stenomitos frigidus]|uniref:Uncharacterized protein n=1 Tax=Stenomitos frigidus ULC18 TaxID=2107698 RepID=A0A2T1DXW1_9CYAN|nr:hypothetical protein [Stenomitos frigidus]PSB25343.1 hypothetical protein C7B82_23710 [Stenomitos frigidus ULC18]